MAYCGRIAGLSWNIVPRLLLILFLCSSLLGDDFLLCSGWVGVFFFGFYFLSGFLESVIAMSCPFSALFSGSVHRECLLMVEAG